MQQSPSEANNHSLIHVLNKFLDFYVARKFTIICATGTLLICDNLVHDISCYFLRFVLIFFYLRLGAPDTVFPSCFRTEILYALLSPPCILHSSPTSLF
jgi:hypothetical protein